MNDLSNARTTAEIAQGFNYPQNNHNISGLLGLITLWQNDISPARRAFETAVSQADQILNQTPQYFGALDAKAMALSGLALCAKRISYNKGILPGSETGEPQEYVEAAKAAYRAARTINADAGVVRWELRLFDALAVADETGVLKTVRDAAEGK